MNLPMSRYRDNLIKQALKSNELTFPSTGIFGFSQKSSSLILFLKLNPAGLSINRISEIMPPFIAKAKQWSQAIAKGETPSISSTSSASPPPSGLFGLISK